MKPGELFNILKENNINSFMGVPDSLLKDFCAYISDYSLNHTITANEGNAIALAAGCYLSTGEISCVYMQNSGLGNCVNPLLSLIDEEVYNIPVLMLIGWRGEPGIKDEPQHIKQGKVTNKLLEAMGIEYSILPDSVNEAKTKIEKAINYMKETKKPYAFIVKKGTFEKYELQTKRQNNFELSREEAIESVIKSLSINDVIVSTTGQISREVYEIREKLNQSHKYDFLTVGSMGHASSIALAIAINKPNRNVFCFDGDGAFLMHMGAICVIASKKLNNFKHIVFNNQAHDSVGSQPTVINNSSVTNIALNCGYKKAFCAQTKNELNSVLDDFIKYDGCALLEIKVKCGARKDLGRPKEKPVENKEIFMDNLNQISFVYDGAINMLPSVLKSYNTKSVLVFRGKKSFEKIKNIVQKELSGFDVFYYNDFTTNPKEEELKIAIEKIKFNYDTIAAIGGGSVIDFAKAYKYYTKTNAKLIAIPTTCATGSEATQFAVLYKEGKKISLDDKTILPDCAIVDCQFVLDNPRYLRACGALDTFCQALESFWAVGSTIESKNYAKEAIKLCKGNIISYVNEGLNAQIMMKAANLSGKAINISRTTAAHALSYAITTKYNIPHGHSVSLSMKDLFIQNYSVNNQNCIDKRGVEYVKNTMKEILNILETDDFTLYWQNLLDKLDIEYDFSKLNIIDKDFLKNAVNMERLKNNPVKVNMDLFWI